MDWLLFIDESGDFSRDRDTVCVAGILMPDGYAGARPSELCRVMKRTLAHVPWPHHTWLVRHPMSQVVWWCERKALKLNFADAERAERLEKARKLLMRHAPASLKAACERADGKVRFTELESLRVALNAVDPTLGGLLRSDSVLDVEQLEGLVRRTRREREDEQGATLFVCAESWSADALVNPRHGDRYLTLLDGLLERVAQVLASYDEEPCRVLLRCLGRDVFNPTLGQAAPMSAQSLRTLLASPGFPTQRYPNVAFEVLSVDRWHSSMDSRLVLSDIVANGARTHLKAAEVGERALRLLEQRLCATLALPLRSGPDARPHLAAGPTVARWLREANDGAEFDELSGGRAALSWCVQQAREWLPTQEDRA